MRNPKSRLGLNGPNEIKSHVWFKEFEWVNLLARKLPSPFVPNSKKANFNKKGISADQHPEDTPNQEKLNSGLIRRNSIQRLFNGFKYDVDDEKKKEIEKDDLEKKKRNKVH